MTNLEHPSDEVLLAVIANEKPESEQSTIESHISDCGKCQNRLMALADSDWLQEFRQCLSDELLTESTHGGSGTHEFLVRQPCWEDLQKENEFESGAINQMLQKIMGPPSHPETMGRLGRYEVERVVGVGGMGVVLRGYDRELQRPVAIKLMIPRLANNGPAKQRFTREARAVAAILHPNVIAVHGIHETKGMPWFVMPFVAGPSLRTLVEQNGPFPEREIVRIGLQIASGLSAAHSQGVVHRDIKPDNVLVDNQINRVVITDFGLARRETEETITRTGVLAGTLNYMSPEQTRGEDVDGRSDLFSLGALLYYLATGKTPFKAEAPAAVLHNVSNKRQPDVRSSNPEISKTLAGVIDTLLAKKPAQRFQTAAELESFLERYVSHLNKPTQHRIPGVPKFSNNSNRWIAGLLMSSVALVAGFCAFQFLPRVPSTPVTAESMWAEIQAEYRLESPTKFHQAMKDLEVDFNRLENSFAKFEINESENLKDEANSLGRSFDLIESAIQRLGTREESGDR